MNTWQIIFGITAIVVGYACIAWGEQKLQTSLQQLPCYQPLQLGYRG